MDIGQSAGLKGQMDVIPMTCKRAILLKRLEQRGIPAIGIPYVNINNVERARHDSAPSSKSNQLLTKPTLA